MHTPVLLPEVLDALLVSTGGRYIDCTGGEGGYTQGIISRGGTVLTLDADPMQAAKLKMLFNNKAIIEHANFKDVARVAKKHGFIPSDGVVFDLGLSYMQLIEGRRGFSYKALSEPLDMRLNAKAGKTAAWVLNTYPQDELEKLFIAYAEEPKAAVIARETVKRRKKHRFMVVDDVVSLLFMLGLRKSVARVFQALRIEVNEELTNLVKGLEGALEILRENGRIVVVSFHSLEERKVKQFATQRNLETFTVPIRREREHFESSATIRVIRKSV